MERRSFDVPVAGAVLHCQEPTYWDLVKHTLLDTDNDYEMILRALHVRALSRESDPDQRVNLSVADARTIVSRFSGPQLEEFDSVYVSATQGVRVQLKDTIPKPEPKPHWMAPPSEQSSKIFKGSKRWYESKDEALIDLRKRFEELKKTITPARPVNTEVLEAEEMLGRELEEGEEVEVTLSAEEKLERFKLEKVYAPLGDLLMTGLLLFPVTLGDLRLTLRYVSPKEQLAINKIYSTMVARERAVYRQYIASFNDVWVVGEKSAEVDKFIDSLDEFTALEMGSAIIRINEYVQSLLPYTDALIYLQVFSNFWTLNKGKRWWHTQYTMIPGADTLPENPVQERFRLAIIEDTDTVSDVKDRYKSLPLVASMTDKGARYLDDMYSAILKKREGRMNYMLYEFGSMDLEEQDAISVSDEGTLEDLVTTSESLLKGKVDFHDLMLEAFFEKTRKEKLRIIQQEEAEHERALAEMPPVEDGISGGSRHLSPKELGQIKSRMLEEQASRDALIHSVTSDAMDNLAKKELRRRLLQGNPLE